LVRRKDCSPGSDRSEFGIRRFSETAFIGAAVGLAACRHEAVVELMFRGLLRRRMDSIYNLALKQSYFSGGQRYVFPCADDIVGGGYGDGGQHSQCLYATFAHLPGMKVVIPSAPMMQKGLLLAAIRDPNPVVFMYHKALQGMGWLGTIPRPITHVPEEDFVVPIGRAAVVREGDDVTLVGWGIGVHHGIGQCADVGCGRNRSRVLDLRTLAPLDRESILRSVRKTGPTRRHR